MTDINIIKSGSARIFVQDGGPNPDNGFDYMGALTMDSPTQSIADPDPVYQPSSDQRNKWDIIDEIDKAQPLGSVDFTQLSDIDLRSIWWDIYQRRCAINVQINTGNCGRPDNVNDWQGKLLLRVAKLTGDFGLDGTLNALSGDDNAPVNIKGSLSFREMTPLKRLKFGDVAGVLVSVEVKDGIFYGSADCGDCGPASDGCDHGYFITVASTSPSATAKLIHTSDGSNFTALNITTLTTFNGDKIAAVGDRLVVISEADLAHHTILVADADDDIDSWARVSAGYITAKGPRAIWSKSAAATFIAAAGGYIYLMTDPSAAVVPVTDGSLTAQNLNAIHGQGDVVVAVGASNAVVFSNNGGDSFSLLTGPAVGVALTAVAVLDRNVWMIGTANGKVFYTMNQGKTWTEKVVNSALTAIDAIVFVNETVGYIVAHKSTTNAYVYATVDSGFSWSAGNPRLDSPPTSALLNGAAACSNNKVAVFGRVGAALSDGVLSIAQ